MTTSRSPRTLLDKVWDAHLVRAETEDTPAVLYVDLHLVHEVTSPQAFAELRARGIAVRRPDRTVATIDHSTPTTPPAPRTAVRLRAVAHDPAAAQLDELDRNCREQGIPLYRLGDDRHGIVHVIGPELGLTQPGMTIVCGDSHTSTHGAFGALAFGIGTSEVAHVLATQCLLQRKPKSFAVRVEGRLRPASPPRTSCSRSSPSSASAAAPATRSNMAARPCGARHGGPHDGLQHVDRGRRARRHGGPRRDHVRILAAGRSRRRVSSSSWRSNAGATATDPGARLRSRRTTRRRRTRPDDHLGHDTRAVDRDPGEIPRRGGSRTASRGVERALATWAWRRRSRCWTTRSTSCSSARCTNSRLSDLRVAASMLASRRIARCVRMLVVPGSQEVKRTPRPRGSTRSSAPPAPSGASPAARCASP